MGFENSIINSQLFRKVENSEDFYAVEDLLKDIKSHLEEDRRMIYSLLNKALHDSDELKEQIQVFNEIDKLPNVMIFGDIPNKYLDNLNANVSAEIQFLNAVQKLQMNYVNKNNKKGGKAPEKSNTNIMDFLTASSGDDGEPSIE